MKIELPTPSSVRELQRKLYLGLTEKCKISLQYRQKNDII